jgi:simple sugar transport system ATP-binding protein
VISAERTPALELHGVSKWYGQVRALDGVDLSVYPGEVHGILGDNGAGKSTMLKIAAGVVQPDAGEILIEGRRVRLLSPLDARAVGIETVYQDLAIAETRSCTANVFVGREITRRGVLGRVGVLDRRAMHSRTEQEFAELGVPITNPKQQVGLLSGGQRQGVAIARAAMWAKHLVLLDEPTAALGLRQKASVDKLMREMRERGLGVMLISHDVPEVLKLADRVTILRLGRVVASRPAADTDLSYVVEQMVSGVA